MFSLQAPRSCSIIPITLASFKFPSVIIRCDAPAAGEAAADNAAKTVVLKDAGATKMQVIKLLKEITGLGLVEAKGLADNGGNVKENVPAAEAEEIKAQLEEAGATIELV